MWGKEGTLPKILAISQHAVPSWYWKSRQGQYALEREAVARPQQRMRAKKITSKLGLGLNFAVNVFRFATMISIKKKKTKGKNLIFVVFLWRKKRSFLFLPKFKRWYSAKIADIFVFIGYLNLKDFLMNGDNW